MLFKNAMIYTLTKPLPIDFTTHDQLNEALEAMQFNACSARDMASFGWVPPLGKHGELFVHAIAGYTMICMKRQEKLIPASVLNDQVMERVDAINALEGRSVGRKERQNIKEEILFDLIPTAMVKNELTYAYIAHAENMIVINTASAKKAEALISLLRETIGSVPVIPLTCESVPQAKMTEWLLHSSAPKGFELGSECRLSDPSDASSSASFVYADLHAEEIVSHVKSGMYASKLGLHCVDDIDFVIDDRLALRKIKFGDVHGESISNAEAETAADHFDADFILMTGCFSAMIKNIVSAFDGLTEHGAIEHKEPQAEKPEVSNADSDIFYQDAVDFVREEGRVSCSVIQRKFRLGYNRSCRIIEQMEANGVVSAMAANGGRVVIG